MASTYSPSLRLELIGDGDQSGTWGQTTNNNLGYLIEQAVAGVITITMTDANYTMSNYNGVVDEARNQVLVFSGALTATRNVIAPLAEKTYVIKNSTTGSQSIQIIGSSGLGVTIPNGATTLVYCDGTNFYNANTGTAGNFAVNGNLSVTGTTTLTGATTMSSALTYGGVALSNSVTGTGSMVLSASPTLTGAPLAPTATAGTNTTQVATTAFVQAATTALGLGTMSTQNANNVAITGGTINGTTLGATTAASVRGTTGTFTGALSAASASFTAALPVLSGGTGVTTSTGTGDVVLSTSPTLVTPLLGTPTSGNLANCTFPTLNQNTTGTAGGLTGTPNITVGTVTGTTIGGTTITASTQFSGPGTGLTGTAASLSIGGTAATATNATNLTGSGTISSTTTATTQAVGTNNTTLATTAFVVASAAAPSVPSGSVMLFYQAAAPSGWTQVTSLNDYDLRLVSGTGGTTGGTTAYSTVFTNQTPTISGGAIGATTLSTAQIPSHTHTVTAVGSGAAAFLNQGCGSMATGALSFTTGAEGGGGSHTHSITAITSSAITLNVRYANIIICSKN